MNYDLPCKLFCIMGSPCGGAGAFAGTLVVNGYWHTELSVAPCWETVEADRIVGLAENKFSAPDLPTAPRDVYRAARFFYDLKKKAMSEGKTEVVIKSVGTILFQPELFKENSLGVQVIPVLVWRHPTPCANSIRFWFPECENPDDVALRFARQIEKLNSAYGWPMWRFGIDGHDKIEEIVGESFSNVYLDMAVVRN